MRYRTLFPSGRLAPSSLLIRWIRNELWVFSFGQITNWGEFWMGDTQAGSVLGSTLVMLVRAFLLEGVWSFLWGVGETSDSLLSLYSFWGVKGWAPQPQSWIVLTTAFGGNPSSGAGTGFMYWNGSRKARLLGMFSKWMLEGCCSLDGRGG